MIERSHRSLEIIATLLNLTPRRCRQLAEEGIVVKRGRGEYDVAASVRNYTRSLQERAFGAGTADLQRERGRLLKAQADRAEIQVGELRATLIPVEQLERALLALAVTIRSRLLHLPRKLAPRISPENPREAETQLESEIHAVLEELAESADAEREFERLELEAADGGRRKIR